MLGIDDFAFRKGQVYGTILVDLERHQPVDLLPERSADAVATWLGEHPGVEVITRDRSAEYAEGARRGAPDALQVADRFHLLQNLRDVLQRLAEKHQDALLAVVQVAAPPGEESSSVQEERSTFVHPTAALAPRSRPERERRQERRDRRSARYQRVKELRAQGLSMSVIAEQVHLRRRTVRRYCRNEQFPERSLQRRPSKLDAFGLYLEQRLAAGEDNALQLWRELREQCGYSGASRQVSRWVAAHRHLAPAQDPARPPVSRGGRPPASAPPRPAAPPAPLSAHKAAWLLIARPKTLEPDEQQLVERLCGHSPTLATADTLAQAFTQMVRERKGEQFDGWLGQVASGGAREFQQFALGFERDKAAVAAALSSPVERAALSALLRNETDTLRHWLERLPPAQRRLRPFLSLVEAGQFPRLSDHAEVDRRLATVAQWLAEERGRSPGPWRGTIEAELLTAQAYVARARGASGRAADS